MCTRIMVCHGNRPAVMPDAYSGENRNKMKDDSKLATYYITKDGKYAVDADFVSAADLEVEDLDLTNIPKIALKDLGSEG